MKVFKLNEGWNDDGFGSTSNLNKNNKNIQPWSVSHYLINRDVESPQIVKSFCDLFELENKVFVIYTYAKDILGVYPDKITDEELLYISKDLCKVIITIKNGLVTTLKKEKITYQNGVFNKKIIDDDHFSIEKFKYLMI